MELYNAIAKMKKNSKFIDGSSTDLQLYQDL